MALLGFGLETGQCVRTGVTKSSQFGMSVRAGGLVTKAASAGLDDWVPVTSQEILRMRQWQRGRVEQGKIPWQIIEYSIRWYGIPVESLGLLRIYSGNI